MKRKVFALEFYSDDQLENEKEIVCGIIKNTVNNEYVKRGQVDIKVIHNLYKDEDTLQRLKGKKEIDDLENYSLNETIDEYENRKNR